MPLIEIRALPQPAGIDLPAVMIAVAAAVTELLQNRPQGTWVTWETIEHYVEGPDAATEQPRDTHPPIVTISAAKGRPQEAIEQAVSAALARELGLEPDSVFVIYRELG
jgi:phenylpyruvate tautomerase PptA (4-oxalocrotonate tautomerase family)